MSRIGADHLAREALVYVRQCQWRLDFPQKRRRKIPQLAGWRSAMRWIGASVLLRPPSALERRWDWRGG